MTPSPPAHSTEIPPGLTRSASQRLGPRPPQPARGLPGAPALSPSEVTVEGQRPSCRHAPSLVPAELAFPPGRSQPPAGTTECQAPPHAVVSGCEPPETRCLALCVPLGSAPRLSISCGREDRRRTQGPQGDSFFLGGHTCPWGLPVTHPGCSALSPQPSHSDLLGEAPASPTTRDGPSPAVAPPPALRAGQADGGRADGGRPGRRLSSRHTSTHGGRTALRRREPRFQSWLRLASAV